jgi:hypothetical protein
MDGDRVELIKKEPARDTAPPPKDTAQPPKDTAPPPKEN